MAYLLNFRHCTRVIARLATNGTVTYLGFQHRIVGSASTPELIAREYVTNVDHQKADAKNGENDCEKLPESHSRDVCLPSKQAGS